LRPERTTVIASAVAGIYVLVVALALRHGARGVSSFIDDACYYLIIARNFAQSGFPTFDGLHGTNGFHPLWMLLLSGMYSVVGADAPLRVQILGARLLETVVLGLALAACVFAFARLRGKTPLAWGFVGAALVLLAPRFMIFEQGMESTLAAALLVVALYALLDRRERLFAASLALLFLARLDSLVFVIPPLLAAWALGGSRDWRREWKVIVPLAVVAAAYMGLNYGLTGSPTPISGQIKSSFPRITPHFEFLVEPLESAARGGWSILVTAPNLFAVTVGSVLLAIPLFARRRELWIKPLAWILLTSALLVANLVLFQRWNKGVDPRYLALAYVLLGFAAFAMLAGMSRSARVPAAAFAVLAVAWAAVDVARIRAEWNLRVNLPGRQIVMALTHPGERFAGTDVGGFAFWLERPFVNLDGVVNNRGLQDAIRDKRLARYLEESDVRYLKLAFWDAPQAYATLRPERMYLSRIFPPGVAGPNYPHYDFILYSYIHDADSEPIRLCPEQEIFREAIGRDGTANAAIVIYRLSRPIATAIENGKEHRCAQSRRAP
jgi:hypothetical protein